MKCGLLTAIEVFIRPNQHIMFFHKNLSTSKSFIFKSKSFIWDLSAMNAFVLNFHTFHKDIIGSHLDCSRFMGHNLSVLCKTFKSNFQIIKKKKKKEIKQLKIVLNYCFQKF